MPATLAVADDRPAAARLHRWRGIFHGEERADQVDPQDFGPGFGVLFENAVEAAGNSGVGEEDVEPAMVGNHVFDQGRNRRFVASIANDVGALEVGTDHRRALASEQVDGCLADARSGAGDDRDFPRKAAHQRPTPIVLPPSTTIACPVMNVDASDAR